MPVNWNVGDATPHRSLPLPHPNTPLSLGQQHDLARIGTALQLVDTDIKALLDKDAAHDTAIATAQTAAANAKAKADAAIPTSQRAVANGVATLDGSGFLTTAQIPTALLGALTYQGAWNAATNVPALASGVGSKGHYYSVSVAGTTTLNGVNQWDAQDKVVYNGTAWERFEGAISATEAVAALAGTNLASWNAIAPGAKQDALGFVPATAAAAATAQSTADSAVTAAGNALTVANGKASTATATAAANGLMSIAHFNKVEAMPAGGASGSRVKLGSVTVSAATAFVEQLFTADAYTGFEVVFENVSGTQTGMADVMVSLRSATAEMANARTSNGGDSSNWSILYQAAATASGYIELALQKFGASRHLSQKHGMAINTAAANSRSTWSVGDVISPVVPDRVRVSLVPGQINQGTYNLDAGTVTFYGTLA